MNAVSSIAAALVLVSGLVVWGFTFYKAVDNNLDGLPWKAWAAGCFSITVLVFALIFMSNPDDHPTALCMSGHQEWVTHCSKGCYQEKHWVCSQWEAK